MSFFYKQQNGWQQDDVNLLKELTTLLQEGRMTVQVPNFDLDLNKVLVKPSFIKTHFKFKI